jgi:hypothetical protein
VLLRMLGDVRGRRIMGAGFGHGYLSGMLADRGVARGGLLASKLATHCHK